MPILIDEVVLETIDAVTEPTEQQPMAQQIPLAPNEMELVQMLDAIRQRQERLQID